MAPPACLVCARHIHLNDVLNVTQSYCTIIQWLKKAEVCQYFYPAFNIGAIYFFRHWVLRLLLSSTIFNDETIILSEDQKMIAFTTEWSRYLLAFIQCIKVSTADCALVQKGK